MKEGQAGVDQGNGEKRKRRGCCRNREQLLTAWKQGRSGLNRKLWFSVWLEPLRAGVKLGKEAGIVAGTVSPALHTHGYSIQSHTASQSYC